MTFFRCGQTLQRQVNADSGIGTATALQPGWQGLERALERHDSIALVPIPERAAVAARA